MYAVLKRPDQSASVHINIDGDQQLEQLKNWVAPGATLTLSEVNADLFPDYSTLSPQDYEQLQAGFAKAVKALPIGTCITHSSTFFESSEDFRLHCSSDKDFKATWAPYVD